MSEAGSDGVKTEVKPANNEDQGAEKRRDELTYDPCWDTFGIGGETASSPRCAVLASIDKLPVGGVNSALEGGDGRPRVYRGLNVTTTGIF